MEIVVLKRRLTTILGVAAAAIIVVPPPPAGAVNTDLREVVSESPMQGTPHVMNGAVKAITQVGNKIIAAGTFTSVSPSGTFDDRSDDVVRHRIFAFDATTGVIDRRFNPNLGGAANSLATDGTYVYVGGSFESVRRKARIKHVVKLDAAGAVVSTFRAVPSGDVNEVVVRGRRLYIGGAFTSIRRGKVTTKRTALALLNARTGAVSDSFDLRFRGVYDARSARPGITNVKRFDVTADGSRLAAVGNFARVAGRARSQVVVLNTRRAAARLTPWSTNRFDRAHNSCARRIDTFVRDVDFSRDGRYFVVTTTGGFGGGAARRTMCDTSSRWETASRGNDPTWVSYTGGDTSLGVAVTGSAVYIGSHSRWQNNPFQGEQAGPGAVRRQGIAALDPVNGLPLTWNPGRERGVGAQALLATRRGLWVGSDTTLFDNQRRGRISFLPLVGGTYVPDVRSAALPSDLFGAQQDASGVLVRRGVDIHGVPTGPAAPANSAIDWSTVRGAFLLNGALYYGLADGGLYKRSFDAGTGELGPASPVNLYDDPDDGARIPFPIASVTGMFYDPTRHRIYYTLAGDSRLYYRYFTPQSDVVGALTFQADAGGVDFGSVAGMTLAGGRILYGSTDGSLRAVTFGTGRVTGTPTVLDADGTWKYRALFVPNS